MKACRTVAQIATVQKNWITGVKVVHHSITPPIMRYQSEQVDDTFA
jgi:hypothetical protein